MSGESTVASRAPVELAAPRHAAAITHEADVASALRNATKLGTSLLATWGVALVVRVLLPRWLGPAPFGAYQFADAFTAGLFAFAALGVDTYVRKEIATRREHAGEFYGGLLLLRLALSVVVTGGAIVLLAQAGKPPVVLRLVLVLALTQLLMMHNGTLGALMHAIGEVGGLSVLSVASKCLWGVGSVVALVSGGGVLDVALAMLLAEALKTVGLEILSRRHLALPLTIDLRATRVVLIGSMPFFIAGLSQALAGRVNISVMSFIASDTEVGWYGAANSVAGISMLLAPLLGWVVLPLVARAQSRSPEDFARLTRRTMGLVLTVATPITLIIALGADVLVHILFGDAYAPAVLSLRALAPTFVLTYVGMVSGSALIGMGRGWWVTAICASTLVVSPSLSWLLIPHALATFGPGGAGVGAAVALNVSEALNAVVLTMALGSRAFDRAALVRVAKMLAVCAAVVLLDREVLVSSRLFHVRLLIDAITYFVLAVLWNAGDIGGLVAVVRRLLPLQGYADAPQST